MQGAFVCAACHATITYGVRFGDIWNHAMLFGAMAFIADFVIANGHGWPKLWVIPAGFVLGIIVALWRYRGRVRFWRYQH